MLQLANQSPAVVVFLLLVINSSGQKRPHNFENRKKMRYISEISTLSPTLNPGGPDYFLDLTFCCLETRTQTKKITFFSFSGFYQNQTCCMLHICKECFQYTFPHPPLSLALSLCFNMRRTVAHRL